MEGTLNNIINHSTKVKKFILTSGCSYTLPMQYTENILTKNEKWEYGFARGGVGSASIKYLKHSVISFINRVIENKIELDNVYVVGNLTQFGRRCFKFNEVERKLCINLLLENKHEDEIIWNDMISGITKYYDGFSDVNGILYSSLVSSDSFMKKFPNDIRERMQTYTNSYNFLSFEEMVLDYFTDLIILQTFLKKNNVKYTLFFMNNIIEGWSENYKNHIYTSNKGYFKVPDMSNTNNIRYISNEVNSLFELIDFDNIVLYSNEKYKFGGIDEYAIENFKVTNLTGWDTAEIKEYYGDDVTFFGEHPELEVQMDFEKKFIYPRIREFINL